MKFLLRSVIIAAAVWVTTLLPLDVSVEGGDGEWWARVLVFILIGALIALLNAVVRPIVNFVTLPVRILTLGLFSLVIGWFMLWLASKLSNLVPWATLEIGGFWKTLLAAVVIAIATAILSIVVPGAKRR